MEAAGWMAYNPSRFWGPAMRRRHVMPRHILMEGATLLLVGALTSCALSAPPGRILYKEGRTVVQLEADPSVGGTSLEGLNSHPASIKPAQVAAILRGIQIRSEQGLLGILLSLAVPAEAVFTEDEVAQLAPVLADGLAQAGPSERVSFRLWSVQPGRRNAPLSGYVSVRNPYLKFGLNEHPTIGWQDPEDPSAPKLYELEFQREAFLRPGTEEERKAGRRTRPLIQIDYRRYLAAAQEPSGPAAAAKEPPGVTSAGTGPPTVPPATAPREKVSPEKAAQNDLQRQVKELTDSNQELRARLKEALARQESAQAANEELTRLRQELAETKQLLADKVLELNRLKNKSGGTKGKK